MQYRMRVQVQFFYPGELVTHHIRGNILDRNYNWRSVACIKYEYKGTILGTSTVQLSKWQGWRRTGPQYVLQVKRCMKLEMLKNQVK
uniref:Uncharacterized protein n=1 Tax=Arundo donax TaxID=35708 RepID=A0A0A9GVL5_ARUDO